MQVKARWLSQADPAISGGMAREIISIDIIVEAVARDFAVAPAEILAGRHRRARRLCMYLACKLGGYSHAQVGRALGTTSKAIAAGVRFMQTELHGESQPRRAPLS